MIAGTKLLLSFILLLLIVVADFSVTGKLNVDACIDDNVVVLVSANVDGSNVVVGIFPAVTCFGRNDCVFNNVIGSIGVDLIADLRVGMKIEALGDSWNALIILSLSSIFLIWVAIFHCWKAAFVNNIWYSPGKMVAFFIACVCMAVLLIVAAILLWGIVSSIDVASTALFQC
jgi:hypothetical protein